MRNVTMTYVVDWFIVVEWSYFENFSRIVGSHVIGDDSRILSYEICDLEPGNRYFVRVRAGNAAGFGIPSKSSPASATPSSEWNIDFYFCQQ